MAKATTKTEPEKPVWKIEEIYGAWWVYETPRPELEQFKSHNRPSQPRILGPFHCQEYAEKRLDENLKSGKLF
jgi:hypothetical protein